MAEMKITILGCGSSGGVPRGDGDWGACDPSEPKNRRMRCSMLARLTGENAIAEIKANREAFDTRLLAPKLVGKSVLIIGGDKDTSVPVDSVARAGCDVSGSKELWRGENEAARGGSQGCAYPYILWWR